jgi:hypothetical protein
MTPKDVLADRRPNPCHSTNRQTLEVVVEAGSAMIYVEAWAQQYAEILIRLRREDWKKEGP